MDILSLSFLSVYLISNYQQQQQQKKKTSSRDRATSVNN